MKILIQVSGSISAYKVCSVVSTLKKEDHEVKVAATASALKFVGEAAWEALSGNAVFSNDFSPGQRMEHIYLNDWADLICLAPATAKTLNHMAMGVGDEVTTTLFLARNPEKPYLVFPAMNPKMWGAESLKSSLSKLKAQKNIEVFEPNAGTVACGHKGEGRLREPFEILNEILKWDRKKKTLILSFGGTTEDIDGVRKITNFSTGKTGLSLMKDLKDQYGVTALVSEAVYEKNKEAFYGVEAQTFVTSDDLEELMLKEVSSKSYDKALHLAAVSDYIPEKQEKKISSEASELQLKFKKRDKILDKIKTSSLNKNLELVSFKLTHNQNEFEIAKKIKNQLEKSNSDYVVHNTLSSSQAGEEKGHQYEIWSYKTLDVVKKGRDKSSLAKDLLNLEI